jgi:tetratricopeptide (TPR) repeat protein
VPGARAARAAARDAAARAARILPGALGPRHPILATLHAVQARVLWELGAIEAARDALDGVWAMLEDAPQSAHPMAAGAWFQAGALSFAFGDLRRAAQGAQRGIEVGTPAYGPDHPLVLSNLAVASQGLLERDELGAAQLAFERVVSGSARTCARPHADLAIALPLLAEAHGRAGNPTLARRIAEEALATAATVPGERTTLLATTHLALGNALVALGDLAAGGAQLTLGRELVTSRHGSAHPVLLPLLVAQARLHLRAGQADTAAALCERTLSIGTAAGLTAHLDIAAALELLGDALQQLGHLDAARQRIAQAADIVHRCLGERSARAARVADHMRRLANG